MATIATLTAGTILTPLRVQQGKEAKRTFLYSELWRQGVQAAQTPVKGLTYSPSDGGNAEALAQAFVQGKSLIDMISPRGDGMDPPFTRMRPAHQAVVVEMRTRGSRTFGFFQKANVFVAVVFKKTTEMKQLSGEPDKTKEHGRYNDCAGYVLAVIRQLDQGEYSGDDISSLIT